jgi:hypothetical protein
MTDFPAAHSMDACWFAVDRDGHVGFFDTGESGAMPEVGVTADDAYALRERLTGLVPAGDFLYDPRGRFLPGDPVSPLPDGFPALVFLSSLAPAQSDVEAGRATVLRATEGYAVVYPQLSAAQSRRLRDSGAVTGWTYHHVDPVISDGDLARYGIYEYTHLCENWIAGPYGRERVPARRLHIDQLPPNIRRDLRAAHLPGLSFADTSLIQPMEHWPCESWEPGWLGTDGVVRPVEGRAEEYEQLYDEMRDESPRFRFEPPPAAGD